MSDAAPRQERMSEGAAVRSRLDHPVIDTDGHFIEIEPILIDYIRDVCGADLAGRYREMVGDGRFWAWYPHVTGGTPSQARQPPALLGLAHRELRRPGGGHDSWRLARQDGRVRHRPHPRLSDDLSHAHGHCRRRDAAGLHPCRQRHDSGSLPWVRGPHRSGRDHPDQYPRRGHRGTRIRGQRARHEARHGERYRPASRRRGKCGASRHVGRGLILGRPVGSRQRIRLRPLLGQMRRTRHSTHHAQPRHRLVPSHVHLELQLQSYRSLRRCL